MSYLVICMVAFLASALTYFSGFGLGTLLLPAFALFFPVEQAIVLTAIIHFLNGLFKLLLVARHAAWGVVLRFGLPAIAASAAGASALTWLANMPPVLSYTAYGEPVSVTPVKFVVGLLLLLFAGLEMSPRCRRMSFRPSLLPVGGLLSGFFGGLSGMQGALRSAFLVRAGLTKEAYIGTGVVLACLIDIARLAIYSSTFTLAPTRFDHGLLAAVLLAAFLGTVLGNSYLQKITLPVVQRIVAVMLSLVALGMVAGVL
jgi:hypothetical protein